MYARFALKINFNKDKEIYEHSSFHPYVYKIRVQYDKVIVIFDKEGSSVSYDMNDIDDIKIVNCGYKKEV